MERHLVKDYLEKSMFSDVQADALSRIFDAWTSRYVTKEDFKTALAEMEARMTWRIIGAMAFLAALMTVLDAFID
jgi:hypothetical protein